MLKPRSAHHGCPLDLQGAQADTLFVFPLCFGLELRPLGRVVAIRLKARRNRQRTQRIEALPQRIGVKSQWGVFDCTTQPSQIGECAGAQLKHAGFGRQMAIEIAEPADPHTTPVLRVAFEPFRRQGGVCGQSKRLARVGASDGGQQSGQVRNVACHRPFGGQLCKKHLF